MAKHLRHFCLLPWPQPARKRWPTAGQRFALVWLAFCLVPFLAQAADRTVLVLQFPPDMKVSLVLHRTGLIEKIEGDAEIKRKFKHERTTEVSVTIKDAPAPSSVKPEYQTYVVWGVDGKGEFTKFGATTKDVKLDTPLTSFGIVVSLESDPAVTKPSGAFVLESGFPEKKGSFYGMTRVVYTH